MNQELPRPVHPIVHSAPIIASILPAHTIYAQHGRLARKVHPYPAAQLLADLMAKGTCLRIPRIDRVDWRPLTSGSVPYDQ